MQLTKIAEVREMMKKERNDLCRVAKLVVICLIMAVGDGARTSAVSAITVQFLSREDAARASASGCPFLAIKPEEVCLSSVEGVLDVSKRRQIITSLVRAMCEHPRPAVRLLSIDMACFSAVAVIDGVTRNGKHMAGKITIDFDRADEYIAAAIEELRTNFVMVKVCPYSLDSLYPNCIVEKIRTQNLGIACQFVEILASELCRAPRPIIPADDTVVVLMRGDFVFVKAGDGRPTKWLVRLHAGQSPQVLQILAHMIGEGLRSVYPVGEDSFLGR